MSTTKKLSAVFGAAILASAISTPVLAGPSEALAGCKAEIAGDARLSQYERVSQNTDEIKRRGRFTKFEINVKGVDAEGASAAWVANCKARNNGQVEELQLVQVGGSVDAQVAQTSN